MTSLENKIPPLVLLLIFGSLMWGVSIFTPVILFARHWQLIIILIMLLSASFFCLAGVLSFKQAHTTVNPLQPEEASTLVNTGIYKVSRNPMYVGFALYLAAWTVYLSAPFSMIGLLGFIVYMNQFQIIPEERILSKLFGNEFEDYRYSVRRWL